MSPLPPRVCASAPFEPSRPTPGAAWTSLGCALLLAAGSFACGEGDGPSIPPVNEGPTVAITSPANGSTFGPSVLVTFTGEAQDAEDGELSHSIIWTSDRDGEIGTGESVQATLSPGTHVITARVSDSDGSSASQVVEVTVDAAPSIEISGPSDGALVTAGTEATFTGSATDPEDGDLSPSIDWESDIDGPLGSGGTVVITLSEETHTITASVRDSYGSSTSVSITVRSEAPAPPEGVHAYVANWNGTSNSVSVIEVATATVVYTIPVGRNPRALAAAPDGRSVYVANQSSQSLSILEVATARVAAEHPTGASTLDVAISPDGATAYVVGTDVLVVDLATGTVSKTIPIGSTLQGVAFTPDGSWAYVTDRLNHRVHVIDVAAGAVEATVPVGARPEAIAVSPDGSIVYVANRDADTVTVIDVGTRAVIATIGVGASPAGVAFTPDGATALVANYSGNSVSVIDVATATTTATILVQSRPEAVAVTPDGTTAYVTNAFGEDPADPAGTVSVIDIAHRAISATVPVGDIPHSVVFARLGAPAVSITAPSTGSVVAEGTAVTIEGIASDPEDGDLSSQIGWESSIDGALGVGASIIRTLSTGSHVVTATVTDSDDNTTMATIRLMVEANQPPTASFVIEPAAGHTETLFTFDASGSSDAEDPTAQLEVRWDWESDGTWDTPFAVEKTQEHQFTEPGTYSVLLQVRDSHGALDQATAAVDVVDVMSVMCVQIDFETLPNAEPSEGLLIGDQFLDSLGVSFALQTGELPRLAQVGAPATAFGSSYGADTPAPGQGIGSFFLTDDGELSGLEAQPLVVSFASPADSASGVVLDIDFDEVFTIEALDQAGQVLETVSIAAGDPGTGDGIATDWGFRRDTSDVYSIRFVGTRTDAGFFGLGFDNFTTCVTSRASNADAMDAPTAGEAMRPRFDPGRGR